MITETYSISAVKADFVEQLLKELGIKNVRSTSNLAKNVESFEIKGYSAKTHFLVGEIFDRLHDEIVFQHKLKEREKQELETNCLLHAH